MASIKNSKNDTQSGVLTVDGDLIWEGDFNKGNILEYFPSCDKNLEYLHIKGDFVINGELIYTKTDAYVGGFGIKVEGNLHAESVWLEKRGSLLIEGDIYAKRYIYIDLYSFSHESQKIVIKNLIDTPLFIIGTTAFKHRGSFSENCLIVEAKHEKTVTYHPYKIYRKSALNKELIDEDEKEVDIEKLIEWFEDGKSIFKDGYTINHKMKDPKSYYAKIDKLIKKGEYKEAQKELDVILKSKEIDAVFYLFGWESFSQIFHWRSYYQALIWVKTDSKKNAPKIEKEYLSRINNLNILKQLPQEMLAYGTNYLTKWYKQNEEYQKELDLLKCSNNGDKAYYVRKTELLLKLGNEAEALIPAHIAIEYFGTTKLKKFQKRTIYQEYIQSLQKKFTVPKGSRQLNLRTLTYSKFYTGVDRHDKNAPITYKTDLYWNSDFIADKDISCYFKVYKNRRLTFVVLGDLYVKGKLFLNSMDIYVEGNIIADSIHLKNSQCESTGNITASREIIILDQASNILDETGQTAEDMAGNSITYICGDVKTPLFVINPEYFHLRGTIAPKTTCIELKGFQLKRDKKIEIYSEKDLNEDINMDDILNENLYQHLQNNTLIKRQRQ